MRYSCPRHKTPQGWAVKDKWTLELEYYRTRELAKAARDLKNLPPSIELHASMPW